MTDISYVHRHSHRGENGKLNCSLTKTYALIFGAIAMLGVAIVLAYFFLNWPALLVAIGLAATVSFVMIPQIRSSISDYATCRGPSQRCSINSTIDILGQAAALISIVSWVGAVALEIPALAALASILFAWLGVTLAGLAASLRITGIVGAGACIGVLLGVLTSVIDYKACRDSEGSGGGPM
jgi:hypothetical protein